MECYHHYRPVTGAPSATMKRLSELADIADDIAVMGDQHVKTRPCASVMHEMRDVIRACEATSVTVQVCIHCGDPRKVPT